MKKLFRRVTASVMCVVMLLSFAPLNFITDSDLSNLFSAEAEAGSITPVSIKALTLPSKSSYYVGETVDISELSFEVTYDNGTKKVFDSGFSCSPQIFTQPGTQNVTVECEGLKYTFSVSVLNVYMTSISVKRNPDKTVYYTDEELDTTGLELLIKYNNGAEVVVTDFSNVTFTYNFKYTGQKSVRVQYYENGKALTTVFSVNVLRRVSLYSDSIRTVSGETIAVPVKILYNSGISGFKITMNYDADAFTPLSVEGGAILEENPDGTQFLSILNSNVDQNPNGTLDVIWSSSEDMKNNGTLFTVYFAVDEAADGNYSITIDYDQESTFSENEYSILMDCSDADIFVEYVEIEREPTIVIDSLSAKPGQIISIPVKALSVPETEDFEVNVMFDKDVFSYIGIESDLTEDYSVRVRSSGIRVTFDDIPNIKNSVIFRINLEVSDTAIGDYLFELDADDVELENGTVSVVPDPTTVWAEDIYISPNSTYVDVPVFIANNQGLMGFGFDVEFDNTFFDVVSVSQGEAITNGSFDYNIQNDKGVISTVWYNSTGSVFNGQMFVIRFKILSNKIANSKINILCDQDNTFNESWEDVEVICNSSDFIVDYVLKPCAGKSASVKSGYVYGIAQNLTSLDGYVTVPDNYKITYNKNGTKIGTDTKLNVLQDNKVLEEYTVLLFGDLNCDGKSDGMDEVILNCILKGMISENDVSEAVMLAADCNHDCAITNDDSNIVFGAGVFDFGIDQTHVAKIIYLNANGGKCEEKYKTVFLGDTYGTLPPAEKDHYRFVGWYTEKDGGEPVDENTTANDISMSTVYSHWEPVSYNVTVLSADNSMGSVSGGGTVTYGESIAISAKPKTGFTFLKWSDGNNNTQRTVCPERDSEYIAYFEGITCTVSLNPDGGVCSKDTVTVKFLQNYPSLPVPTKENYLFDGWYNSNGEKIDSSVKVNTFAAHELCAHWKAKTFTVTFNANGGTCSTSSKTLTFGDSYGTLPTPTRTNYNFKGWFTASSGGTQISASTVPSSAKNITLYAQWTGKPFTVTFNANGGTCSTASKTVNYGSGYGTLPTPTRTNYDFKGWFTASSGGTQVSATTAMTSAQNTTLYAQWTAKTFTVTFNANGGTCSTSSRTLTFGDSYGTLPTPTRTNYNFKGWFTASSGGTQVSATTVPASAQNITLYAQWTGKPFTVTFNANGGTCSTASKTVNYGSSYGTLPVPTQDYYTFSGWYTASSGGTQVLSSTVLSSAANTTVYAHWTINPEHDWVEFENAPPDAYITSTKYQYTLTSYKSSSSSYLDGWTRDKSKGTDGCVTTYGNWSALGWSPISSSLTLEARAVTVYRYYYFQCANCGYRHAYTGYNCDGCGKNVGWTWYETWSTIRYQDSNPEQYYSNKMVTFSLDGQRWYFDLGNRYDTAPGTSGKTTTDVVISTMYQSRTITKTYYYYKIENKKESETDPTGQANVSNVVRFVKYREK